jgi:hypothetical protein
VDQEAFTESEDTLSVQRIMRRRERLREATRRRPIERVGHGQQVALVHDAELGLSTPTDHRHHPIADGEPPGTTSEGDDLAGELEARDVRG